MYTSQAYDYLESKDEYVPLGEKVYFLTLGQAISATKEACLISDDYMYLITSVVDEWFKLWSDEL